MAGKRVCKYENINQQDICNEQVHEKMPPRMKKEIEDRGEKYRTKTQSKSIAVTVRRIL